MKLYNYSKSEKLNYNIEKAEDNLSGKNHLQKYILTFNSPYRTGVAENDSVHCELFLNQGCNLCTAAEAKPEYINNARLKTAIDTLLIVIHGFSTKKTKMDNYYYFISKAIEKNVSCAFINLPFHLHRSPKKEKSGERLIYYDDVQTLKFFHQSVVDVKKFIDIISNILQIKNTTLFGLSLGSMVSLITMAYDRRIKKGIFLIGGGNWYEIHWNSALKFILRGNCSDKGQTTKEKCREFYSDFPDFLNKFKQIDIENIPFDIKECPELKKVTTKMCFLCDPLAFAHKLNPKNILMINSKLDFYFSKKSTTRLWEELGKPEIYWLNNFHTSKILRNKKVINKTLDFILKG